MFTDIKMIFTRPDSKLVHMQCSTLHHGLKDHQIVFVT